MKHSYRKISMLIFLIAAVPPIFFHVPIEVPIWSTLTAILFVLWDISYSIRKAKHEQK
nr:MAG TPA: hypothetical protein [Caudoviricetes sp.]